MPRRLAEISPDDPSLGGKARGLAVARAAGLAVPDGWVLAPGEEAPRLDGGPYVVRSSAALEDTREHAAPGIFTSVRDVAPHGLAAAVAEVRASAGGPAALAYREAHALGDDETPMAVIIQEQVAGTLATAWSRSPGGEAGVLIEAGADRALVDGDDVHGSLPGVPAAALREAAAAARVLETALGGPADVELVFSGEGGTFVVQARRIPPAALKSPVVAAGELAAALAFSRAEPGVVWTWDAEHNPAPLSLAQAGLVELVDAAGAATVRQRVVLRHLYTAPGGAAPRRVIPRADLARVYDEEIRPAFEADLARMGVDLAATLDAYLSFYRRYSLELAPSLAAARDVTVALPAAPLGELSAAWDVAEPTYGERDRLPGPGVWPAALRDVDDLFFARAQSGVRRALLALAARWSLDAGDIFELPLGEILRGLPDAAAARAAESRRERVRLAAATPPVQIVAGRGLAGLPAVSGAILRGRGVGGRARGRIFKIGANMERSPPPDRILLAAALIPTMAPLLVGARAAIVEHGGLLGHGVALARELGVPCLTGCVGALTALSDGDEVWVDAEAGLAVRLAGS